MTHTDAPTHADRVKKTIPRMYVYGILLALILGTGLRLYPTTPFSGIGFDEQLYQYYTTRLNDVGVMNFPKLVEEYITRQAELSTAILPPTRFIYIFCGHIWCNVSGQNALAALHDVSSFFAILMLFLSARFAWRLGGAAVSFGVTLLMACAPTQIHMSQHALIDGFFAFWALLSLYLLWESLQSTSTRRIWQVLMALSIALMVLTKENAFFVFIGLVVVVLLAPLAGYAKWRWSVAIALGVGAGIGAGILLILAGGLRPLLSIYSGFVGKVYQLEYAIRTGDGPWFRYIAELMLVAPLVMILTFGSLFRLNRNQRGAIFLTIFMGVTYWVMCNIEYGMNLRYTNMWDMPIRYLAVLQIIWITNKLPRYAASAGIVLTAAIATHQLILYTKLCVGYPMYELISSELMRALLILK
jgi:hypothetical protein